MGFSSRVDFESRPRNRLHQRLSVHALGRFWVVGTTQAHSEPAESNEHRQAPKQGLVEIMSIIAYTKSISV